MKEAQSSDYVMAKMSQIYMRNNCVNVNLQSSQLAMAEPIS